MKLTAHPPFSLPAITHSHGWIRLAPFGEGEPPGTLTYVTRLDPGPVVELCIREIDDGVSVEFDAQPDEAGEAAVARQVSWMLGLDQDLSPFYEHARHEPKLAQVVERAQGRLLRSPTLFEDTVKTILTTNTTWSGTIRMVGALVDQFGEPLPADPARHAFPAPERLAASDAGTLRTVTRLGYRAPYVLELARAVSSGDLDLEGLKTSNLPTPELRKRLLAIKGVGAYAAAHLLMLLERYDFVPIDSWALKMVSHEWHDGQPIVAADVEAAFEPWGPWRGLAYWFWDWSYRG
jgi:3-methyladenine DNA glycosylase/8-oxoguanine DNA glycosylase